jgi:membrane protein
MVLDDRREQAADSAAQATAWAQRLRRRLPWVDHAVRTVQHYGLVRGGVLAGGVTFYGFLSFFPLQALAFALVGYVANIYPDAEEDLVTAIQEVLPGLIGDDPGQISIDSFKNAAGAATVIGALGLLYTGLGWLSATRAALVGTFEVPQQHKRNFVVGKAFDLVVLAILGLTLLLTVGLSGAVTTFSRQLLDLVGLDGPGVGWLLRVLTVALALGASTLLFFVMYRLLPGSETPAKALVGGAVLAALVFEVLKSVASLLIAWVSSSPAAAVLGVSLVLLVWINYFARTVVLGAAWSHTAPAAVAAREAEAAGQADSVSSAPEPAVVGRRRGADLTSLLTGLVLGALSWAWATRSRAASPDKERVP